MSVEQSIVSHVVRNGEESLLYLIEHGITIEYFHSRANTEAWRWIVDRWNANGEVPSEEMFQRRFPRYIVVVDPDSIVALADELRGHHAIEIAKDLVPPIVAEFEKPPDRFELPVVLGQLAELQGRIDTVRSVNEVAVLSEQMSTFLDDLLSMGGVELPGIPTGFSALDAASGGWQAENFGVIGAGPKRFKTAILVWMALAAARAGYYSTVTTFEMSINELMQRIYCLGAHVNYTHILRGTLSNRERHKLEGFTEEFKSWPGDIELIHDIAAVTSLSGMAAKLRMRQRKPDIVFIDGIYQMTDDSREWSSEAMALTAVSRGLKRLAATEGIPIVGTTQALLSRISARKGTSMASLGYTSAFAQDANVILAIDRNDMMADDIVVRVVGARAMAGMAFRVTVELDTGQITEGGEIDGGVGSDYD